MLVLRCDEDTTEPTYKARDGEATFYREETLRRLEEEAEEFQTFLERLRKARDKAEFDQFMAERGASGPRPASA